MQKDKKKRLWKIAKELLQDPLQTTRELEKKTWISKSTIANYINNDLDSLGLKDEKIIKLTDWDFEMMQLIQQKKFKRLQDTEKPVDDNNLNQWDREAKARYSLFRWDATDDTWALKTITDINIL